MYREWYYNYKSITHNFNEFRNNCFTSLIIKGTHAYYQNIPMIQNLITDKIKIPNNLLYLKYIIVNNEIHIFPDFFISTQVYILSF